LETPIRTEEMAAKYIQTQTYKLKKEEKRKHMQINLNFRKPSNSSKDNHPIKPKSIYAHSHYRHKWKK
jgi:hypothetical protein